MSMDAILKQLIGFEKRLDALVAEARETSERAQKVLGLVTSLREEIRQAKNGLLNSAETQEHTPLRPPRKA